MSWIHICPIKGRHTLKDGTQCEKCHADAHADKILEKALERMVIEWARAHGWLTFKWQSQNNRGVPDRLFFKDGLAVAIEFKRPGERPTKLQQLQIDKLRAHRIPAFACDNVTSAVFILEHVGGSPDLWL